MKDLELEKVGDDEDLKITNFDLTLVDGIDRVRQKLSIRLKFFFREWFLDATKGVKFYEFIFVKNSNPETIAAVIKAEILETPDVNKIVEYSHDLDSALRKLTIVFKVDTSFGLLENTVTV